MPRGITIVNESVIRDVVLGTVTERSICSKVKNKLKHDAKRGNEIAASLLEVIKARAIATYYKRGRKSQVSYANLIDLVPESDRGIIT